jgi:hypothetical protein
MSPYSLSCCESHEESPPLVKTTGASAADEGLEGGEELAVLDEAAAISPEGGRRISVTSRRGNRREWPLEGM